MIGLDTIDRLTGGRLGVHDAQCPLCSARRSTTQKRRAKVLRIWRPEKDFASYHCAHCGEGGYAFDRGGKEMDPIKLARMRAEQEERARLHKTDRLAKARWLWSQRQRIDGTPAERYLRNARGYSGPLPVTLGFLPGRGNHLPAMIAAFGAAHEVVPGVLVISNAAVTGAHLTRLTAAGVKAGLANDKIMIGQCLGSPIVLAPPNDLLGLAITEGIEDALSMHDATGLGAWAAGSASRLPALAEAVPYFIDCVTIAVDDDDDGRRNAKELAARLQQRGIWVEPLAFGRGDDE